MRHTIDAQDKRGFSNITAVYATPIAPGRSRAIIRNLFKFKSPIPRFFFSKLHSSILVACPGPCCRVLPWLATSLHFLKSLLQCCIFLCNCTVQLEADVPKAYSICTRCRRPSTAHARFSDLGRLEQAAACRLHMWLAATNPGPQFVQQKHSTNMLHIQ